MHPAEQAPSARRRFIGTASWTLPKQHAVHFPLDGSHLARYAQVFPAVEINSSFYKPHRTTTYARWSQSVPAEFRFAVKVPKRITHELRLVDAAAETERFLSEIGGLGEKLGPVLVQLPPSFEFNVTAVGRFFVELRRQFSGSIVCEPRHLTWFTEDAERLLREFRVARVAADPAITPMASQPGGWTGLSYFRLHGSPHVYYSAYDQPWLSQLIERMHPAASDGEVWCIFDNTALGHATANALQVLQWSNPASL